jgi:hypothetical protein
VYVRDYNKAWYQKHKECLLEKRRRHDRELKEWIKQYKNTISCIVCGESHPACLQFHHRERKDKSFTIGAAIGRRRYISFKKLQEEVSKCDILCGNCHAILHWNETHDFDDWSEVLSLVEKE